MNSRKPNFKPISLLRTGLAALVCLSALPGCYAQTLTATVRAGLFPYSVAVNPVTNKVYVANFSSSNVTVIDGATNATATVIAGSGPISVAVNPVTNKVYVANFSSSNVTVIDGATNATATVTAGSAPYSVAVNPVTNKIYVANRDGNTVTVIDGATDATATVTAGTSPISVAVNPLTNKIYVANFNSDTVTVIDGVTNATVTVTAGTAPISVAVNPVTNKIYVANRGGNTVTVIDGATNATATVTTENFPFSVAVNPLTNKIYVANFNSDTVTVIDGATNATAIVNAGSGPISVAVNPVTNKIYVANRGGNTVTVIDGATNATATVTAGTGPESVAVNPLTNKIYVANSSSGNVTVIDGATNTTATVTAGNTPVSAAVNPVTNKIYVANFFSDNVTVIDGVTNATASVNAGSEPFSVAVNPLTNKIYVVNPGSDNVTVIDGVTNTTTTVAVGSAPISAAVNPVTNKIYVVNLNDVTVIDGVTNATATVAAGSVAVSVAVNPVTNKIYVANQNSNNVTVIDGVTNNTTTVTAGSGPFSVGVNPVTNKIYVANDASNTVTVIDGVTNNTTTVTTGSGPVSVGVNPVTNKIYVANQNSNNVTVIDGVTNNTTTVTAGSGPVSVGVNPVTNKIYVANYAGNTVTVIDGVTNNTTTVTTGSGPVSAGVNPVTNKIYVANYAGNNVTVITEEQVQPIPLTTSISALPGNQTSSPAPAFTFSATSSFSPTATTPDTVFYQADTWQGLWSAAKGSNPSYSGTLASLQPGFHILYAYAGDSQEATSTQAGSPLTGAIRAYGFLVVPPPLSISSTFTSATRGASVSASLTVTGGTGPFTVTASGLPAGLSISPTGSSAGPFTITGTPIAFGTFTYTVKVTDANGATASTPAITLTVAPGKPVIAIGGPTTFTATQGIPIAPMIFTVTGAAPFTIISKGLPPGLSASLTSSSGSPFYLNGTPTAAGVFSYSITITDVNGNSATVTGVITVNGNLISFLDLAGKYSILGVSGFGGNNPQVHIQSSINYTPGSHGPVNIGIGINTQLHVDGNIVLNNPLDYDPTARIQIDGQSSFTGPPFKEPSSVYFAKVQGDVGVAFAQLMASLPVTQSFLQQIQSTTTITGNGGQNVIAIGDQIRLDNGSNLYISGCPTDTFIFNIAQGKNFQLNGSSIILEGKGTCNAPLPSQVAFNFLTDQNGHGGGNVQIQNASSTNGIFLDVGGQIQIQGGTHNSIFISGNQIQIQQGGGPNNQNPVINPIAPVTPLPTVSLSCPAGIGLPGAAYNSSFSASGGTAPYTYSLIGGSVAPLSFTAGTVAGTLPTNLATAPLTFTGKVVDAAVHTATALCSVIDCLLNQLGTSFSILGISGAGQNNPQIQIQDSVLGPVSIGVGSGVQLHLTGNASLGTNVSLDEAPGSTVKLDGNTSNLATVTTAAISSNALALSAQFAAMAPTQTFNQIQNTTTITGDGARNVILITNQIHLDNSQQLIISGGPSDTFVFNFAQGQNFQLNNGASIVLQGVTASQVVFNFGSGNGGNVQLNNSSASAGIFLDPFGQITIQGGAHNSVFISGNQIQLQNSPTFTAVTCK